MWEAFLKAIKDAITWFFGLFVDLAELLMSAVLALIPDHYQAPVATLKAYLGYANAWAPLDVGFGLIVAYYLFYAVVISVRWIKSFVPTIAN